MPVEPNAVYHMDALELLAALPSASVDAVITDPPYAEVDRDYGRLTEEAWMRLMQACVIEFRRVLKPTGSALMVLQPNARHNGSMRLWLWEFMVWCGRTWNIVQDAYWWNYAAPPVTGGIYRTVGLLKPSLKYLVWIGNPDCYRNQDAVLWSPSKSMLAANIEERALRYSPSGMNKRNGRLKATVLERGGAVPMNVLPVANVNSVNSGGAYQHGAATPYPLVDWWTRYISKTNDLIVDPFAGSGTMLLAARNLGRRYVGGDQVARYVDIARMRLETPYTPLLFNETHERKNHEDDASLA